MYKDRYLDKFVKGILDPIKEVYINMFQFLQRVARIFSRKDGSMLEPIPKSLQI